MRKAKICIGALVLCFIGTAACAEDKLELPKEQQITEVTVAPDDTDEEEERVGLSQIVLEEDVTVSLTSGKCLDNLTIVGEDNPYYCNLEENMRGAVNPGLYRVLVCKDPVYDITYYVNYGRDYFIYALRDGKSELVVEMPASELYCREGELYFMVDNYNEYVLDGMEQGNILKYNPKDGTVEVVIAESVGDVAVYPDGICYEVYEKMMVDGVWNEYYKVNRYYYSFETKMTELYGDKCGLLDRWKEYQLVDDYENSVFLATVDGNRVRKLEGFDSNRYNYWIKEDAIYYVDGDSFVRYDMNTMESEVLAELAVASEAGNFLIVDNVYRSSRLLRIALDEGTQYIVDIENGNFKYSIHMFYSDGEKLYCINDNKIWCLVEEQVAESGYVGTRENGRNVEYDCYQYKLYVPGE